MTRSIEIQSTFFVVILVFQASDASANLVSRSFLVKNNSQICRLLFRNFLKSAIKLINIDRLRTQMCKMCIYKSFVIDQW